MFVEECKHAMVSIEAVKILENPENMRKLVMKLPYNMHDKWRHFVRKRGDYSTKIQFSELAKFIDNESVAANHPVYGKAHMVVEKPSTGQQTGAKQKTKKVFATTDDKETSEKTQVDKKSENKEEGKDKIGKAFRPTPCLHCKGEHRLAHCKKFEALDHDKKLEYLKENKVCFKCLRKGHFSKDCLRKEKCTKCQGEHPSVMHKKMNNAPKAEEPKVAEQAKEKEGTKDKVVEVSANAVDTSERESSTLAIIPVKVSLKGSHKVIETLAFLDPGSTATFCSESLMTKLNCTGKRVKYKMETLLDKREVTSYVLKNIQVSNLDNDEPIYLSKVYTKDINVSKELMPTKEDITKWPHLKGLLIPNVQVNSKVELLIGNNNPEIYRPLDTRTGKEYEPYAIKSKIGWVVWGLVTEQEDRMSINKASVEEIDEIDSLVRESINMDFPEKLVDDKREYSVQDRLFIKKTQESIQLNDEGKYEMDLPFQGENVRIPNNINYVKKRLIGLKDKLDKDVVFKEDYVKFMAQLINKGYVEQVLDQDVNKNDGCVWYIPHHGIRHPRKNKMRVVFDCSSKYLGISLNDLLLPGPNMTNNLQHVLLRFRQEPIAFMGDIESMFYQVKVPQKHRDFLRFFWWPNGSTNVEPKVYRMTVHLFGAVSSPACANFALRQVVTDNKESYDEEVVKSVINNFYVDDVLKSVATPQKAIALIKGIKDLCNQGGFHLKDWVSNNDEVIASIPEQDCANVSEQNLDIFNAEVNRALGIVWSVSKDTFEFKVNIKEAENTRRGILRIVSSLYDPLGLVAVFTLPVKCILRRLCQLKLKWDDEIPEKERKEFKKWLDSIKTLENIKVPRCVKQLSSHDVKFQLHAFADASEVGYGVAIYVRSEYPDNSIHCSLLIGKSRVSPLKKITIPKLELTAATLAARMTHTVSKELDYQIEGKYFWTDSTAVLQSIANETTCYNTFVANRLNVIHEATSVKEWNYVESKLNPSDFASRGLYANCDESKLTRWFQGPMFLSRPMKDWPDSHRFVSNSIHEEKEWLKKEVHSVQSTVVEEESIISKLIEKYSSWTKLKRVVGKIILAIKKFRKQEVENDLSKEILDEAEKLIVQNEQRKYYDKEIKAINQGNIRDKRSPLYKLDPIIKDDIIRVGGRLNRASISFEEKHPIILSKKSRVSELIVVHAHVKVGHQGKNAMMSYLQENFWITNVAQIIKSVTSKCVVCRKYRAQVMEQKMADLPKERVNPVDKAFSSCGCDFFGPIEVKRGRSMVKRYGVIFTCLNSRAVHLEVAHSLDTSSCINAITRFIARRGPIKYIRSDNGTNLVGSEKELRDQLQMVNATKIKDSLVNDGIKWEFNPPSGSHFGGVWERLIRSVRKILYILIKDSAVTLDDEGLITLFCEVESILNNRPITNVPNVPCDLEALTPNHLLHLKSGKNICPGDYEDDCYSRKRWRQIQFLSTIFWKRWLKEYLPRLQERQKWCVTKRNVIVGDIVLIVESNIKNSYCLGKVTKVITDKIGHVRSVEVKTKDTILKRPISKLCLVLEAGEKEFNLP